MGTVGRRKADGAGTRAGAVIPLNGGSVADDLQTLYDRYKSVSGRVAPDLIATPDMAYARATLIRALLDDGWNAPEIVHERLRQDEDLLRPRLIVA
jgi:hypothetical protein